MSLHDLQQPTCSTVVAAASQPVPPDLVDALAERPWRTGLEPAEDVDMLEVPADCIEGTIPPDLVGTLFRNGAGRIRVGSSPSTRYNHWFDGDGMVAAATFTPDGRCYFRQKYLRGAKFLAQEKAGEERLGSRGVWTQKKGEGERGNKGGKGRWWQNIGRLPGNPLNTNVLVMEGGKEGGVESKRVWALCEGGPPFEFDPVTLDVQAEPELFVGPHGQLSSFFSAHPKQDPDTGTLYNVGMLLGPSLALNLIKISPASSSSTSSPFSSSSSSSSSSPFLLRQHSYSLPAIPVLHDFVLAGRFLVIFLSPYQARPPSLLRSLLGLASLGEMYRWEKGKEGVAWVFEKETLRRVAEVAIDPPFSNYHFVNAWERGKGGKEGERARKGDQGVVLERQGRMKGGEEVVEVEVVVAQHRSGREEVEKLFRDMYHADFSQGLECETWRYVIRFGYSSSSSSSSSTSRGERGGTRQGRREDGTRVGELIEASPLPLAASSYGYELPTINPLTVGKEGRYAYVNALVREEGFIDTVAKLDLREGGRMEPHTWSVPSGCFAGEAVFIPKGRKEGGREGEAEEDEGYLVFYVFDSRRQASDLVVIDAQKMENPPLAVVHLPVRVPYSYHGAWTTDTFGVGGRAGGRA
ncbi:carotenoid oxygenase [Nannochloropsis oceanica]